MSIVTNIGDKGTTQLLSGLTVSKSDPRITAIGTLDELNSCLGLARTLSENAEVAEFIYALQLELMKLGTELSSNKSELSHKEIGQLEEQISSLEKKINLPDTFVIPGKTACSASLDLARAISRRLEREVMVLSEKNLLENDRFLIIYCNRLSDYLFLLGRLAQ
jgi:cob(I)alamin adenosyltransferase